MTEEQTKSKFNVMKTLSICCLIVVIISGFLPWVTLTGNYDEGFLASFEDIVADIPDERIEEMQDALDDEGIDFDIEGFKECIEGAFDPLTDGNVSPMDFLTLNNNFSELKEYFDEAVVLEDYGFYMDDDTEEAFEMLTMIFYMPVIVFGALALAALVRVVLRFFDRKGLGVFVAVLAAINVAFMAFVSIVLDMLISETTNGGATLSVVPFIVLVCSILACVFWGQARKLLNPVVVKQVVEVPVPQNIPTSQGVPVPPQAPVASEDSAEVND